MPSRATLIGAALALAAIGQASFCLYREITIPDLVISQIAPNQETRTYILGGTLAALGYFSCCVSIALGAAAVYVARGRGVVVVGVLAFLAVGLSLCLKPIGEARMTRALAARHITEE